MIEPVAKTIGIITGVIALAAGAWAAGDFMEVRPVIKREFRLAMDQMQQTSESVLLLQFQVLVQKRQYGGLTIQEQSTLCQVVAALNYSGEEVKRITGC